MSQKDLEDAGILLPKKLWGRSLFGSTVNTFALLITGILGLGAATTIYLGDGSWWTWMGVGGYFIFLILFYFISSRAIDKQNERLAMLLRHADEANNGQESRQDADMDTGE